MLKMRRLDRMQMSSASVRRPPVGLLPMNSVLGKPDLIQKYNVIPDLSAARRRFEANDGEDNYDARLHAMHDRRQGEFSPMIPRQIGGMSPERSFHGLPGPHNVMSLRSDDAGMYGAHTATPFINDIAGLHVAQSDMIYRNDLDEMYGAYGPMPFRTDVPGLHGVPNDVPFRNEPYVLHGARSAMPLRSDISGLHTAHSAIPFRSDVEGFYGPHGGIPYRSEILDTHRVHGTGIPRGDETGILGPLKGNAAIVHGIQSAKPKKKKAPKTKRGGLRDDNGNVVRGKIHNAFDNRESAPSIGRELSLYGKSSVLPGIGPKSPIGFRKLRTESEIDTFENKILVENVGEKSALNQFKGFGKNINVIPAIKPSMQAVKSAEYTSSQSYKALDDGTAAPMTCIDKTVLAGNARGVSLYGKDTSSVLPGITAKNDDVSDGLIKREQSTNAMDAQCLDGTNDESLKQDKKEDKESDLKLRPNIDGLDDLQNTSHVEYESSDHESMSEPNKKCVTEGSIQQIEEKSNTMLNGMSGEQSQTDKIIESKGISSDDIATADVIETADNVIKDALDASIDPDLKCSSEETLKEMDNVKTSRISKECFVVTAFNDVNPKQENKLDDVDATMKQFDTQCTEEVKIETGNNKSDIPNIEVEEESTGETNGQHHGIKSPDNSQPQTNVLSSEVAVSKGNVIVINPDSVKRQQRKKRIARENEKLFHDGKVVETQVPYDIIKSDQNSSPTKRVSFSNKPETRVFKPVEVLKREFQEKGKDNSSEDYSCDSGEDIDHISDDIFDNDSETKQGTSVVDRKVTTNISCSHSLKSSKATLDGENNTSTDTREICIHVPIQNGDFEINVKCMAIKKRDDNKSDGTKQHVSILKNDKMLVNSEKNGKHIDVKCKRLSKELMVNDEENEKSPKFSKGLTSSSEVRYETNKNLDGGDIDVMYIEKMLKELDERERKEFIADFVAWYMKPFHDNPLQYGTMYLNLMKIREENPHVDIIKLIQDPTSPDADPVLCGLVRKRSMKKETGQSRKTLVVDNKGLTAVADDKGPGVVDNKEVLTSTSGMKVDRKYQNQPTNKKCLDKLDDNKGQISAKSNKAIGNIDSMDNTKGKGKYKRSEQKQSKKSELSREHEIAHDKSAFQAIVKAMNDVFERKRERIKRKRERKGNHANKRNGDQDESVKKQTTGGIKSFFRKLICICKPKDVTYDA